MPEKMPEDVNTRVQEPPSLKGESSATYIRRRAGAVGQALKVYRTKFACVSRERIARKIGVSSKTIYRWERGDSTPNPLACEKLGALEVDGIRFAPYFEKFRAVPHETWAEFPNVGNSLRASDQPIYRNQREGRPPAADQQTQ